ncbi:MAG: SEC-C domain-containing protein [Chloroflexi bacterium]|nr:SEC-C domain-containing protein [Chloroflexota bacterium]
MPPQVGRNAPCPCGSGKKYKNCHGRAELRKREQALSLQAGIRTVMERAMDVSKVETTAETYNVIQVFWGRPIPPERLSQIPPEWWRTFMLWLHGDWVWGSDGRTSLERLLQSSTERLQNFYRQVAETLAASYMSVYELIPAADNASATGGRLRDIFSGMDFLVEDYLPSGESASHPLAVARLISSQDSYYMAVAPPLVAANLKNDLIALLAPLHRNYCKAYDLAESAPESWREFLKKSGQLISQNLMNLAPLPALTQEVAATNPDEETARNIARRMTGQVILGTMESHYQSWVNKPIPEWSNQTPRQLVRTPSGRSRLELLLEALDDLETGRRASGQPFYDVWRLRQLLGLGYEAFTSVPILR